MKEDPIIILGGGPTGLAAGYRLTKQGQKVIILEKEAYLGGLSATMKNGNYFYELGPHAFHLKDPKMIKWLKKILKKDFRIIDTRTQVLIDGQFYEYPLKGGELLRKINPLLGAKILVGYFGAFIKNLFREKKYASFEDWGLANFGPTLYKISFGDYTAKVWGMSPKKLSGKLASQKLARLNLGDIIFKLLGFKGKEQPAYFKKYLYPEGGIKTILAHLSKEITHGGGQIITSAEVTKALRKKNKITAVEYRQRDGQIKSLKANQVISTIALKDLVGVINHPLSSKIVSAGKNLKYRDLVIVYLVSSQKDLSKSQWIYFVENRFKFNRVSFGTNLSPAFGPKNGEVLSTEICCQKGDRLWSKTDEALCELALADLEKIGVVKDKIKDCFVRRIENAYPIYAKNFEEEIDETLEGLSKIDNLMATGRNGLFLNADIHDSFLMGFEAAEAMSQNRSEYYQKTKEKWFNFD